MKQEATKKSKLWLWILIGAIALLAAAGVILAMVLGPSSEPEKEPGGRPDLYWNVDRITYTENSESGLSTREPGEDGLYKVRFAYNGDLVELTVADKPLINYIDTMDAMGLVMDADGVVIDAIGPKEIATEKTKNAYVKSTTEKKITANSSVAMNGMNINIEINELTQIYDVTPQAEVPGQIIQASELRAMDVLTVYANDLDEVTHIYLTSHPKESKVYWRADQYYNSTLKETKRVPDENGVYTIPFFCEGETVELKFKDKALVTKIDSASRWKCHYGLTFDEEGYVIEQYVSSLGIQGVIVADCWDIVGIEGDQYTIQRLTTNDGSVWTGTIPADCVIYDASAAGKADKRGGQRLDGLQMGDRVTVWTDTNGQVILVYVSNRIVDSPAYWVTSRKYSSAKGESTRTIGASGYYEVELLKEGTNSKEIYYIKDKETVDYFDSLTDKVVGLKVGANRVIESVYNVECLTGYTTATRGGVVVSSNGGIFTKMTYGKPGTESNMVLAANARVYNASQYGTLGAETTVMPGDHIYAYRQPTGEILLAFITKRETGANTLYWNLKLMYDKTNKVTTREPDEEGWYWFDMAYNGKQVKLKTKSKDIATKIDSQSIGAIGLDVSGDVITAAYDPSYAYSGNKVASGYRYRYITDAGTYFCAYNSDENKTVEFKMAEDCIIYNVSSVFEKYKGERIYSLKYNDMLTVFCDIYGEAKVVYVRNRDVDNMYWKTDKFYDSTNKVTTRTPDADGYYWLDLAVNGEVKTFKCKNVDDVSSMDSYDGAFGLNVKGNEILGFVSTSGVKDVKGNSLIGYTVKKIEGNKITAVYNKAGSSFGTEKVIYTKSSTKIYDVSPTAEKFGAEVKLQVGDTFRSYLSRDGKTDSYIYITFHATREGGEYGYCEVCKKDVQWFPWAGGSVPAVDGAHVYLNATTTSYTQTTMSSTSKDYTVCLDLNGHTLTRQAPGRAFRVANGETLNVIDSVGGGKIITNGGANYSGGMAMVSTGGKFNIYGGTFEFVQGEFKPGYGGCFYVSGTGTELNLYDGVITGGVAYAQSTSKPGYGGNVYVGSSATFNMYGGKVSNGTVYGMLAETVKNDKTTYSAVNTYGGNIYLSETGKLNITGGVIENGHAVRETFEYVVDGETKTASNLSHGGNIYKTGGAKGFVIAKDVTITGGKAHRGGNVYGGTGEMTFENVTISGGEATQFGGNIMSVGGDWTLNNVKITDGKYPSCGGNIYSQGGIYTLKNTTVSGGTAQTGGNIYLYKNKTAPNEFIVQDGTVIENGVADYNGGNIYVKNKNYDDADGNPMLPTLKVEGGQILNGVCDSKATGSYYGGNIYLAGHMIISGGTISGGLQGTTDYEIYIPGEKTQEVVISGGTVVGKLRVNGPKSLTIEGAPKLGQLNLRSTLIKVGELTEGAQIVVVSNTEVFSEPCDKAQAYVDAGYFTAYDAEKTIAVNSGNALTINVPKIIKWCDHCSQNVEWQEYAGNEVGSGYNGDNLHLYLPEGGYTQSYGQIDIQGEVTLDLNGQTLTGKVDKRLWKIEGIFNIIDTVGGGVVASNNNPAGGGGIAMCRKNPNNGDKPVVNIYGGTLTCTDTAVPASSSGILNMNADTTLNMFGGEIKGGIAASGAQNVNVGGGTLNMTGGFIDGGILAPADSEINLSGSAKIAKTNDGLALASGVKINLDTMTDAEIYVSGEAAAFTDVLTNADEYLDNIKAAKEGWTVANVGGALTLSDGRAPFDPNAVHALAAAMDFTTTDPDGKVTAECPVCRETVEWLPLGANTTGSAMVLESGHYYLSASTDYTANNYQYSVTGGKQVCINLNGQTLTSTTRVLYTETKGNVVNIMGDGVVTGGGTPVSTGGYRGAVDMTATVNFYGGTWNSSNVEAPAIENRASSHTESYVNIYAGTVVNSVDGGKAIQITKKGNLNICGGTVGTVFNNGSTGTVTVSGAPVISNLDLSNGTMVEVGELTTGADITVTAEGVFTNSLADAAAMKGYFKAADAEKSIVVEGTALACVVESFDPNKVAEKAQAMSFATSDPDGKVEAECPVCCETVTWLPLPAVIEGNLTSKANADATAKTVGFTNGAHHHYYLSENVDYTQNIGYYGVSASTKMCLNLNGQNIVSPYRTFFTESAATVLNIMGEGTVTGAGYTSGTIVRASMDCTAAVNLYGGIYVSSSDRPVIWMRSSSNTKCVLNVYEGTTISAENAECAARVNNKSTINVNGGTIVGGVLNESANAVLSVSGTPVIDKLNVTNGALLTVGELAEGADITVITEGVFTNEIANAAAAKPYFKSGVAGKTILIEGKTLALGEEAELVCPHCGKTAAELEAAGTPWTEWTAAYGSTTKGTIQSGHYYMTADVTGMNGYYYIGASTSDTLADRRDVVLDMRGFSLQSSTRVFYTYNNNDLTIFDSVGGSTITGGLASSAGGTIFFGDGGNAAEGDESKLAIYNVSLIDGATKTREKNGGVVFASGNASLCFEGVTITAKTAGDSGALAMSAGTAVMKDCTINGGTVSGKGGALCVTSTGTLTLENTTVVSGEAASAPGIYLAGGATLNVIDGNVEDVFANTSETIVNVSGTAVIGNLDLSSGAKLASVELTTGADITVVADGVFTADLADAAAAKGFFKSGVADKSVIIEGAALAIGVESTDPEQPEPTDKSIYEQAKEMDFTTTDADGKVTAKCPVCNAEVEWLPMAVVEDANATKTDALKINDGAHHHFYLSESVDYTKNAGYYSVTGGTKVCLNLNGQTLTSTERVLYTETSGTVVNIMGEGTVTGASIINATNKNFCGIIDSTAGVNLYGGTWTSTTEYAVLSSRGSGAHCVVNMYEGTKLVRTAEGAQGNVVYVCDNGEFNMYGGEIIGGSAVVQPNIHETDAIGGNIIIRANAQNRSYTADVNIYDGVISNTGENKGANIYLAGNDGANPTAKANICGGTIEGAGVYATGANASVTVSGAPVVDFLDMVDANLLTVGELTEGASIKVAATKDVAFTGEIAANAETYAAFFGSDELKTGVVVKNNALVLTDVCPHCGVPMADITWTELRKNADNSAISMETSGHYRLAEDLDSTGNTITFKDGTSNPVVDVVIDTAGFGITGGGRGVYVNKNHTLTVFDSVGGSVITTHSTNTKLGGSALYANSGSTVNLYDVTYIAGEGIQGNGACISVYGTTAVMNIYSGTFNGNVNEKSGVTGGTVNCRGTLNIYGGTFNASTLTDGIGSGIYVHTSGNLSIYGGKVYGDLYVTETGKLTVGGTPEINNVVMAAGAKLSFDEDVELTEGADITVDAAGEFTEANENAQAYLDAGYIKAAEGKGVTVTDNIMSMAAAVLTALLRKLASF